MNTKTYKTDICEIEKLNTDGSVYSTDVFESKDFNSLTKAKAFVKSKLKDKRFYCAWIELYVSDEDDMIKQYSYYKDDNKWNVTCNS